MQTSVSKTYNMKKTLLLSICICVFSIQAFNQTISYNDKLYYTCKVWGFVKYYHTEVSSCKVSWDDTLKRFLPSIKAANTTSAFNLVLDSMISSAGTMTKAITPSPAPVPHELSRNLDFGWLNDPVLSTSVSDKLDTIKTNFRPHAGCWVMNNTGNLGGWLAFPHDSVILDVNTYANYPNEDDRVLMLCKYWNIIRYFNPNNYILDIPWDTTLRRFVVKVANAATAQELESLIEQITANLDDAHTEGLTYNINSFISKAYQPKIILRYIDNKYIVVRSGIAGIMDGDEIVTVDGLTGQQWDDSLRPYISAGNQDVFHRYTCGYVLYRSLNTSMNILLKNASGITYSKNVICDTYIGDSWVYDYYPNDSLKNEKWRILDCNVGYVHMGNLEQSDVATMYNDLSSKPAIIFDLRNYPQGTAFTLANYIYPNNMQFSKLTEPDINYPGTFKWYNHTLGFNGNSNYYKGKIILLMNQETQSHAEYSCMIFEAMPNVVKVGSQTAGADGNVTYFKLTNDIFQTGFTTLGVYYPNGDSTQRVGIIPDTVVYPTQIGIRTGRDEVLEKAMEIGCALSVQEVKQDALSAEIYPNPSHDILNIKIPEGTQVSLVLSDITGNKLLSRTIVGYEKIDINSLSPGIYILVLKSGTQKETFKFIKK